MSVLLRELIAIPERAGADDYVLRLTEGVGRGRLEQTLRDYVVTEQLVESFDGALDLVAAALKDGSSRAAFLNGSFGSGKSHFMAVLYALLGQDPNARAIPELSPVLAGHDAVLQDKKVLRLAYHFLGSKSMEQTLLGGYVAQVMALHPDAQLPAVHRGDAVLADAEGLRATMGDDAFLAGLNKAAGFTGEESVWGGVVEGAVWTAASYDACRAAAPASPERGRLVSALVKAYFTAYTNAAEFVPLDEGLAAVSAHAKSLGYDAVVLFLDELVLWLSYNVRNRELFGREAQKLTKLVESAAGERAIPLVSFVARQLDLRKYFVDSGGGLGSEQEALDEAFRHQEGRFRRITLGDDNLPQVAQKRLLAPVDEAARLQIDDAFARLDRRPEVWDVLLDGGNADDSHRGSDQQAFRRTYPFSPALVSTLRTLASAMQRDRTALKVMQQLLVDQRDTLTVADVIPVGDVFDLVVEGNEAVTPEMTGRFRNARKLYVDKLRPMLLREHAGADGTPAFRADDRLVKTLVLSAVAPEVPALKELTAARLAGLNHGSIVSPLAGQEASVVLAKVRKWQGEVPEIRVSSEARNPVIRVQISEVDYESVVEKAKGEDTAGQRRQTLKRLVWEALGLEELDGDITGVSRQTRIWRGSRREVEVIFGNVRDASYLPDAVFEAGTDTWRFVVDYPFDDEGGSVRDDLHRLDELASRMDPSHTVVWLPHFLSAERRDDLGRLVTLDWLFGGAGDRWADHANHLAEVDRVQARSILETQRDAMRDRMRRAVQEAYGAATPTLGTLEVDEAHEKVLYSLSPEFSPQAPVGHDLRAAFGNLVDQVFTTSFPGHPRFEPEEREVRARELAAVLDVVEAAQQVPDGRVAVEPARREDVRRVANALQVGQMGEQYFLFGGDRFRYRNEFARAMGAAGMAATDVVTVGSLREWLRAMQPPMGLRPEVEDLVICAWAALEQRAWYRYGTPVIPAPGPGALQNDMELRPEALPAMDDWAAAVARAGSLFGIQASQHLTAAAVTQLTEGVRTTLAPLSSPARLLVDVLAKVGGRLGVPAEEAPRLSTARAVRDLVDALQSAGSPVAVVQAIAAAELPSSEQVASRSLTQSAAVIGQAEGFAWDRLSPLRAAEEGADERARDAKGILGRLRAAYAADELAEPLGTALKRAEDQAFQWALQPPEPPPGPGPGPTPPPPPAPAGRHVVRNPDELAAAVSELQDFVAENADQDVVLEWRLDT